MTKDYAEMTMSELVVEYNKRSGKEPISKFRDKATALKRLAETGSAKNAKSAAADAKPAKGPSSTG